MPLSHPHRLSLAALAGAAVIALGVAVPAAAEPALPVGLPELTEAAAADLVPAVAGAAGESLAGTWFEDGRLMAGTWDPAVAPVLTALGATPVVRDGPRRDPLAALRELDARTATTPPDGLASYGIDPRTEQLVLDVVEGPDAGRVAGELTAGMDPAAVRVERVPAAPRRQAAVSGGDTISDGSRRCTAGFAASDSAGDWVITAGHCLRGSSTWYAADQSTIGSGGRTAGNGVDVGAIPVERGSAAPTVAGTRVRGTSVAPVGSSVCLYGSTSGRSCGTVERTDVTVNFEGEQQSGLTAVGTCAQEGDSGAPYITSNGQAQGVHTGAGGSGNCTSYFTPIRTATGALGLTLTTG
ncbi:MULTISPECIES: S1 family peptidase [Pseudonocardia]|uniref:Alpha-lytic protease n=2 Tax=Pseudonocardia TaxID=1847 RepID=A0A1Y2N2L6_PSEAH|nr:MULTISPECIES: S1 family peptidase [Pseudonocardia]OSY41714.1 Alpha-lytic protease precursor [Pseudonocardia autotrophica]TDN71234.1 streptogrisin C [Pseudonocardia autotrophica]BBG01905.1 serine protease [Pseudonocardia autotrophica]GEC23070.1 serine protease [Pseudonocardia saturnea]